MTPGPLPTRCQQHGTPTRGDSQHCLQTSSQAAPEQSHAQWRTNPFPVRGSHCPRDVGYTLQTGWEGLCHQPPPP